MDDNEKKMLGVPDNQPTQKAIDAHQRGSLDIERARELAKSRQLSTKQLIGLVKEYAELGDAFHSATKYGISVPELRIIFDSLGVNSVSDARQALKTGLLAGIVDAIEEIRVNAEDEIRTEDKQRQEALDKLTEETEEELYEESQDEKRARLLEEATKKNKEDAMRFARLEAEKIAKEQAEGRFTIPDTLVPLFKKTVLYGVQAAQRQFGGTRKEILAEVKRLMPEIDVDLIAR